MMTPDRIYGEYRDKPKAVAWYKITEDLAAGICQAASDVRLSYDIDSQEGVQLDVIGNILVINRNTLTDILFPVYECGDTDAQCGNDEIQCSQPSLGQSESALSDEYFRILLKSKIAKNNSMATIDDLIAAISITLSGKRVTVQDNEDMSFSFSILDPISDIERTLITTKDIIPKPQAVRLVGFLEEAGIVQCGDDTLQCGDVAAECVGFTII